MRCFHCDTELEEKSRIMLGMDVPYINIWFCKYCWLNYVVDDINVYFSKFADKVYNLLSDGTKKKKMRKNG